MKRVQDGTSKNRKTKFAPRIPPRKAANASLAKEEPSEAKNNVIDKELLARIHRTKVGDFSGRFPNSDKKAAPTEVVFGPVDSKLARSFPKPRAVDSELAISFPKPRAKENEETQGYPDELIPKKEKAYVEPWDYANSYYPVTLPLRRPYSGNPDILNEEEFGKASTSTALDDSRNNSAVELGLLEKKEGEQMLFFQLPRTLPMVKRPAATKSTQKSAVKTDEVFSMHKFDNLPEEGFIGKMMVYKSGKVKMKLGDVLFDVSPGTHCNFPQDLAAINTREKHCCILGNPGKRAVVTPDVDSLLDSLDNLD